MAICFGVIVTSLFAVRRERNGRQLLGNHFDVTLYCEKREEWSAAFRGDHSDGTRRGVYIAAFIQLGLTTGRKGVRRQDGITVTSQGEESI
jgi:hypothetical protein